MMSACHAHVAPPKSAVRRCGPSLMLFRLGFAAWLPRSKIFGRDDERLHPLQPPLTAQVNLNCWRRDMGVIRWAECANFLVAAIQLCRRLRRRRGESRSTYALGADAPRCTDGRLDVPCPGKRSQGLWGIYIRNTRQSGYNHGASHCAKQQRPEAGQVPKNDARPGLTAQTLSNSPLGNPIYHVGTQPWKLPQTVVILKLRASVPQAIPAPCFVAGDATPPRPLATRQLRPRMLGGRDGGIALPLIGG